MPTEPHSLAFEIDAALSFWADAGVDCHFIDDARAWLAERPITDQPDPAKPSATSLPESDKPDFLINAATGSVHYPKRIIATDFWGDSPPQSLGDFQRWWMDCPNLCERSLYPRIAPRGAAGAKLMVIIPDPEAEDQAQLLSGPQGRLLSKILMAMGLAESDVYIASALPCHTPLADLSAMALGGLNRVLALHIDLAAPQRVVMFGQGLSAFLNADRENTEDALREINHIGGSAKLLIAETLGSMLDMPRLKARFWRRWMEWSA